MDKYNNQEDEVLKNGVTMDLVEEVEKKQEGFKSAHTQIENDFSKLKTDFNTFSACSKVVDEFEHGL